MGGVRLTLALAIFFVVLGVGLSAWALFLLLDWPGAVLLAGVLTTGVGLLAIPVDRGDR